MSPGRRTNREAYVLEEWDLPKPVPDAEWQLDKAFNLADELLRDPEIKTVFKVALEKGAEIICRPAEVTASLCFPVVAYTFTNSQLLISRMFVRPNVLDSFDQLIPGIIIVQGSSQRCKQRRAGDRDAHPGQRTISDRYRGSVGYCRVVKAPC